MISKENELFCYTLHDDFAVIESVKEDFPVVEFPKMMEGVPVTELGAYVLSGKIVKKFIYRKVLEKSGDMDFIIAEIFENCLSAVILWILGAVRLPDVIISEKSKF